MPPSAGGTGGGTTVAQGGPAAEHSNLSGNQEGRHQPTEPGVTGLALHSEAGPRTLWREWSDSHAPKHAGGTRPGQRGNVGTWVLSWRSEDATIWTDMGALW